MALAAKKQVEETLDELEETKTTAAFDESQLLRIETETRDFIAKLTLRAFFTLLAVILIGVPLYNAIITANRLDDNLLINLSDLLQQYGAILGPVLGFVIGYYFKTKSS